MVRAILAFLSVLLLLLVLLAGILVAHELERLLGYSRQSPTSIHTANTCKQVYSIRTVHQTVANREIKVTKLFFALLRTRERENHSNRS